MSVAGWGGRLFLLLAALPTCLALLGVASGVFTDESDVFAHLAEYVLPEAIANTLYLVVAVGLLSLLLGTGLAWLTAVCEFPLRRFFSWALFLPMAIPGYVMAFAIVGVFEYTGPIQQWLRERFGTSAWMPDVYGFGFVALTLGLVLYPYVYLMARTAFQTQGLRALEVGQSLGLGMWPAFFRVALPMARPWLVAGLLLVIMETMADFGTVATFNYQTLTTAIYKSWFELFSLAAALQVALLLLAFVAVIAALERHSRKSQRYYSATGGRSPPRIQLQSLTAMLATAACAAVFLLAFVVPCLRLLRWSLRSFPQSFNQGLLDYMAGSLSLALLATITIVGLAILVAFTARGRRDLLSNIAVRASTLGYALPGTVLAIGMFTALAALQQLLQGLGMAVQLQGTIWVMLLALSVRFMAVAYSPLESGWLRVTPSIDAAARSLGASASSLLYRVHLPMLRGSILTAAVLVFVDVMKELPITLMTRPFGFNTLAVRIFELTSEGLWDRAALPALAIVLVGLVPVVMLIRNTERDGHSAA